MGLLAKNAFFR